MELVLHVKQVAALAHWQDPFGIWLKKQITSWSDKLKYSLT